MQISLWFIAVFVDGELLIHAELLWRIRQLYQVQLQFRGATISLYPDGIGSITLDFDRGRAAIALAICMDGTMVG